MKYGNLYATAGIAADMEQDRQFTAEVLEAFRRYQMGDWGVVCPEDRQLNDLSATHDERVLAAYETSKGRIWIITEWDRSATTILYPSEY